MTMTSMNYTARRMRGRREGMNGDANMDMESCNSSSNGTWISDDRDRDVDELLGIKLLIREKGEEAKMGTGTEGSQRNQY